MNGWYCLAGIGCGAVLLVCMYLAAIMEAKSIPLDGPCEQK